MTLIPFSSWGLAFCLRFLNTYGLSSSQQTLFRYKKSFTGPYLLWNFSKISCSILRRKWRKFYVVKRNIFTYILKKTVWFKNPPKYANSFPKTTWVWNDISLFVSKNFFNMNYERLYSILKTEAYISIYSMSKITIWWFMLCMYSYIEMKII